MNPEDFYLFQEGGKSFLLHIPSSIYFELDTVAQTFFTLLKNGYSSKEVHQHVVSAFTLREADEIMEEFSKLDEEAARIKKTFNPSTEINNISLNVVQECNLKCRYCYGQEGTYGYKGFMSRKTGEASLDFLFDQLHNAKECSVGFFGGEPLLNFQLVKLLVPYALEKAESYRKKVHFTITTNGTLLTDHVIKFLNKNRIGVTISIDGPKEIHDYNRPFKNGASSYDVIYPRVKKLLNSRKGRVTARSTATHGHVYYTVFKHLIEMGFRQVHIEPATGDIISNNAIILSDYRRIAKDVLDHIRKERHVLFSNLSDLMGKTYLTTTRHHGCGAALRYVGISAEGGIYVCHRFVGEPEFKMGTVWDFNPELQAEIIENNVDNRSPCNECWARYYCGGGCIFESYFYHRDIRKPYTQRCELFKAALKLSIWLYSQVKDEDHTILDDMYERHTRDYIKDDKSPSS